MELLFCLLCYERVSIGSPRDYVIEKGGGERERDRDENLHGWFISQSSLKLIAGDTHMKG